jgi:hypothetical protein
MVWVVVIVVHHALATIAHHALTAGVAHRVLVVVTHHALVVTHYVLTSLRQGDRQRYAGSQLESARIFHLILLIVLQVTDCSGPPLAFLRSPGSELGDAPKGAFNNAS